MRATILQLLGGSLFAHKADRFVPSMFMQFITDLSSVRNYSWGAACLGWLYRSLDEATDPSMFDIAGPMMLLQMWAWEHFSICRPIFKTGGQFVPGLMAGSRYFT